MNKFASSPLPVLTEPLVLLVVPLASALAFVGQPMLAKPLLLAFGGTAVTWLGAMVFFQTVLLLGYGLALWLERRTSRFRYRTLIVLIVLSIASFGLPDATPREATLWAVIGRLALVALPSYVLLFSMSPLVHAELERRQHPAPYGVYAFSNFGSLGALVLYPLLIEPWISLGEQESIWKILLIVLGVTLALLLHLFGRDPLAGDAVAPPASAPALTDALIWAALAAATCATMLAATNLVAGEIGSNPLAWIGPFGVYLASFTLIFSGRWLSWMTGVAVVALATALMGYMVAKGFTWATVDASRFWWLLLTCGAACTVGHALLHERRPERGGGWFYLAIAAGGMFGGWFSVWGAPRLLVLPWEFPLLAGGLLAAGLAWSLRWKGLLGALFAASFILLPLGTFCVHQFEVLKATGKTFSFYRDIYGDLLVEADADSVAVASGTTTHGTQLKGNEGLRRHPTYYFSESSGVGRVIQRLQAGRPAIRIGVIGLGAGTLAAYLRPGDEIVFWDIDPKIEWVAREHFSYLADSHGKVQVVLADGRRALTESADDFDLIVVDAFMGDGIPAHLLTREALRLYDARLAVRHGILVTQSTMRYSNLYNVVAVTGKSINWGSFAVRTLIRAANETRDWDPYESTYIISGPEELVRTARSWFDDLDEEDGRVTREITELTGESYSDRDLWLDDRQAALDSLDLKRYLFGPPD